MPFGDVYAFDDLAERLLKGQVSTASPFVVLIDDTRRATKSDTNAVLADYTTARAADAPYISIDTKQLKSKKYEVFPRTNPRTYRYVMIPDIRNYEGDARIATTFSVTSVADLASGYLGNVDWARIPGMTNCAQALVCDGATLGEPVLFFVELTKETGETYDLDWAPLLIRFSSSPAVQGEAL